MVLSNTARVYVASRQVLGHELTSPANDNQQFFISLFSSATPTKPRNNLTLHHQRSYIEDAGMSDHHNYDEVNQAKQGGLDYAAKIEHLLQFDSTISPQDAPPPSSSACADERQLVALVLLTNPNIVDTDSFQSLWNSHGSVLQLFCERILRRRPRKQKTKEDALELQVVEPYTITRARLVAAILARMLPLITTASDDDRSIQNGSTILMNQLLELVCALKEQAPHGMALPLITQTLECFAVYASHHISKNDNNTPDDHLIRLINEFLGPLWICYMRGITASSMEVTASDESNTMSPDDQLMEQTLKAILLKTCSDTSYSDNGEIDSDSGAVLQSWKEQLQRSMEDLYRNTVLRIFTQSRGAGADSIALWLERSLENLSFSSKGGTKDQSENEQSAEKRSHYSLQHLEQDIQRSWHITLLLFTKASPSHPSFPNMLNNIRIPVVKLILAHIVSPIGTDTSEDLRLLAWTACAAWVDRLEGYDWMLMDDVIHDKTSSMSSVPIPVDVKASSKSLGSSAYLCAMIRLASGEWRIQLGFRLSIREGEIQSKKQQSSDEHRTGIVQGCAQVLASLVSYLTKIAEDIEKKDRDKKRFISPEALLHLKESLEDGLQGTANYLFQIAQASSTPKLDDEDAVIADLLAAFLSEFDIFDEHTNLDTGEIVTALSLAMKCSDNVKSQELLMTGLIGVLEVAHNDSFRVLLLREHSVLAESTMVDFLSRYWSENVDSLTKTNLSSIPWACHLTELWWTILQDYRSELRLNVDASPLVRVMVDWVSQALTCSVKLDSQEFKSALSAAIGCLFVLIGDHPPNERDTQIIQQALTHCADDA